MDSAGYEGYYVHLTTPAGIVVKTFCMQGHPTWMNDYRSQIGDISLIQLFLPGTYQSVGYMTEESGTDLEVLRKYFITQGWEDVRSQLRLGARYLDIRISEYVSSNVRFWTVHNIVKMHPLKNILEQVRKFVEDTSEIVIFDIHAFQKGFRSFKAHLDLVEFIRNEIEDLMVSPSVGWNGTLNQIWATERRIIVTYGNPTVVDIFPNHLWSASRFRIHYVDDKNEVKEYLYSKRFEKRLDS
ncbi:AGAP006088-PA-like protein [Anopheles sinensis]|uniref:AGAP006088-PA-like protein n=1 Tax=Anopheles sinensis TaxID=74873 RepID=A0A084VD78_ANOSI|nr:AGAP006088-PA-like protein [Anopheles sinensis]